MPDKLSKAHAHLDKAVDAVYGYKPSKAKTGTGKKNEAARVAFLFTRYQSLVNAG